MMIFSHEINLVESRLHSLQEFKQADSRSLARDFTKITDRRGALASVATATRYDSVACDERNFSSSEERALAPLDLSSQRSAKPKASLALSLVCAIRRSTSVARTKNSVITCLNSVNNCVVFACSARWATSSKLVLHSLAGALIIKSQRDCTEFRRVFVSRSALAGQVR